MTLVVFGENTAKVKIDADANGSREEAPAEPDGASGWKNLQSCS